MFEHQRTVNKLGLRHIVSLETEQGGSNILMRGNIRLSDISYYRSNARDSVSVRNNKAKCWLSFIIYRLVRVLSMFLMHEFLH